MQNRDEFLKGANERKNAPGPWCKIFIKKDQRPVYTTENNRLRKKANTLRKTPDNVKKDIKIVKGKLLMDNVKIDENTFFH